MASRRQTSFTPYSRSGEQRYDYSNLIVIDNLEHCPRKGQGKEARKSKQQPKGQKKQNRLKCYNCYKIEHYARDYCSRKMRLQQTQKVNMLLAIGQEPPIDKVAQTTTNIARQGEYNN